MYDNILDMVQALYEGNADAMLMNVAYVDVVEAQDGYETFSSRTRTLYDHEEETVVTEDSQTAEKSITTDLEFMDWIKKNNGIIEMSSAVKVGSMIEFVSGPLKDMNGKIIKINRSRRQVQVSFGSENGIISKVWCSMEFVCSNADSYSTVKENKKEFDSANP